MTWIIKHRGDATAPILADFECPLHGTFEAVAPSNADFAPCPSEIVAVVDGEPRGDLEMVPCNEPSPWRPSPVCGRVKLVSAVQGKSEKPPRPTYTDTEQLQHRGAWTEWKAGRDKVWEEHRYNTNVADGRKGST